MDLNCLHDLLVSLIEACTSSDNIQSHLTKRKINFGKQLNITISPVCYQSIFIELIQQKDSWPLYESILISSSYFELYVKSPAREISNFQFSPEDYGTVKLNTFKKWLQKVSHRRVIDEMICNFSHFLPVGNVFMLKLI